MLLLLATQPKRGQLNFSKAFSEKQRSQSPSINTRVIIISSHQNHKQTFIKHKTNSTMSSRQGFPADTLVADDVVPRMRTSRISSHYRANTVSNNRRSHGLKAARKPLGDRNAKSVAEGANERNAEATKKATVSAVSKTQHSSLSSLSDRCSSRHAVAPVSAGDEPKNAKKTTAKTTPLTVPNNDKENQQTAKSNTLTHRRTPSSKHNKQDLTIAKKSPSSVLKTRKPAVIAHPRSAAAAENTGFRS